MTLGAVAFLNPWLLAGLAALPIIYWLLRTVPPRPKQVAFPPTRIMVGLENRERTPAKTPWWLMLIRLLAAALVIFALAEPVLNPSQDKAIKGTGPVVIVVDNGWGSAARWPERQKVIERLIAVAEAQSRTVSIAPTASASKGASVRIEAPGEARTTAAALQPMPFAPDRNSTLEAVKSLLGVGSGGGASIVWLADGIDYASAAKPFADGLAALADGGSFAVFEDTASALPLGVTAGMGSDGKLAARVLATGGAAREGALHAFSVRGEQLGEARFSVGAGEKASVTNFDLPLELRNQVARIEIAGERSAGATSLLDARSQWHRIGLISGENREQAQPLLAPLYYIQKALAPFSELVQPKDSNIPAGIASVLDQNATVLVLADIGTLTGETKEKVEAWVRQGGVLVRFAGPRLEKGGDELLPVALRAGGRTLGGALSWSTPQPLAAIDGNSLFAGLPVPQEVTVTRQVLADPSQLGSEVSVWARLQDGTPLVTAAKRGEGQIVLFHVTANSDWSNLPISGLFVEMLRRISTLGKLGARSGGEANATGTADANTSADAPTVLPPVQVLDGFGVLKPPPPTAQALVAAKLSETVPSLDHPPGYYGAQGSPRAVNVLNEKSELLPLPALPSAVERRGFESEASQPLKPWMLAAALALIFADIIAVIILSFGGYALKGLRPGARAAAMLMAVSLGGLVASINAQMAYAQARPAPPATAPFDIATALKATSKVSLGYVLTGDSETDSTSRLGLSGLCRVLSIRTAVVPGEPIGVNIERDEIAFYPVLYWPVPEQAPNLPEATIAKIDAYMKQGGMIIFDTRDYGQGLPSGTPLSGQGESALQRLLSRLDIPRLEPVPENHVLTKAFYLLRWFPGRWDGGQMWVEAQDPESADESTHKARKADGVTSILITSNDLASAWALDETGRPLFPVVPGGEDQREMSLRGGINIVMHALTGNYKADQVHVPALLERLGQ